MADWIPLVRVENPQPTEEQLVAFGRKRINELLGREIWLNDLYQVNVDADPVTSNGGLPMVTLSIKRRDKEAIHDWRHFQYIKNQLVGPECEAVELYPAESRLVDTANQYFLLACKDPTYRFPFGFSKRLVSEDIGMGGKQRPFDDNMRPKDLTPMATVADIQKVRGRNSHRHPTRRKK